VFVLSAFFLVDTEYIEYTPVYFMGTVKSPSPDIPDINATISYKFVSKGSFSAQNPIVVTVTVRDVSVPDLLQYYQAVGFFGSVFNTDAPVIVDPNVEMAGSIPLSKQSDGTYSGTWTLIWRVESDTWAFLIPQSQYQWQMKVGPSSDESPVLHISGIADTTTWKFNEATTRFTIILLGFSVLMLQPIFESIFHLKND
jgi:hypothetical protein